MTDLDQLFKLKFELHWQECNWKNEKYDEVKKKYESLKAKIEGKIESWDRIEKQAGNITLDHLQTDNVSTLEEYAKLQSQVAKLKEELEESNTTSSLLRNHIGNVEKERNSAKSTLDEIEKVSIEPHMDQEGYWLQEQLKTILAKHEGKQ